MNENSISLVNEHLTVRRLEKYSFCSFSFWWKEEEAKLEKEFETKVADLRKNLNARTRAEMAAPNAEDTALKAEDVALKAKWEIDRMESVSVEEGIKARVVAELKK